MANKLIITRGLPGTGKSTTLQRTGLQDFTLSTDALRLMYSSPVMHANGKLGITQEQNIVIWPVLYEILERRMRDGMTTVIDAVHPGVSDFVQYKELAKRYGYDLACLDFTKVPREYSEWTNQGRAEYRIVPEQGINRLQSIIEQNPVIPDVNNIIVRADNSHIKEITDWLMPEIVDLSEYRDVVHIGDIQGCLQPLLAALPNGIEDDRFYIFVGDLCDRGDENAQVVRYMIDNVIGKPNVVILRGNHELHLLRDIHGLEPVSDEYKKKTRQQFNLHGITKKDLQKVTSTLQDSFFYQYGDKRVMVSHGGLPCVPERPWMIPGQQFRNGVGYYEQDVDTTFNSIQSPWYQVHGHRNKSRLPIINGRSMNLEGSVEFGGYLKMVNLDKDGWHPEEHKNNSFRPFRDRIHKNGTLMPDWMKRDVGDKPTFLSPEDLASLRAHPGVVERKSEKYPYISSLNFTKDVFFNKSWDDIVNKARGLFIDNRTGEIIARSYDKFFTVGENSSMSLDALEERLVFPILGRQKENGFLGIMGYIPETDELFISSKGTPDGDFATMFRDIVDANLTKNEQESIKRTMRDWECSFTFEVIDPIHDPHIIKYNAPKIVLLDVVRRSAEYEKMPYNQVVEVGKRFGLEVAPRLMEFKNMKQLRGWYANASTDMKKEIEGMVWQDAKGELFKTKYPYYSVWKLMRGTKEVIMREKIKMETPLNKQELQQIKKAVDSMHKNALSDTEKAMCHQRLKKEGFNRIDIEEMVKDINGSLSGLLNKISPVKKVSRQSVREFFKTRDLEFATELADDFKDWCFEQTSETLSQEIIDLREQYLNERRLEHNHGHNTP